jgi:hypothetical protein
MKKLIMLCALSAIVGATYGASSKDQLIQGTLDVMRKVASGDMSAETNITQQLFWLSEPITMAEVIKDVQTYLKPNYVTEGMIFGARQKIELFKKLTAAIYQNKMNEAGAMAALIQAFNNKGDKIIPAEVGLHFIELAYWGVPLSILEPLYLELQKAQR